MSDWGRLSEAATAPAVTGPSPSRRPRTASTSASSRVHSLLYASGVSMAGCNAAPGNIARNSGTRSAVTQSECAAGVLCCPTTGAPCDALALLDVDAAPSAVSLAEAIPIADALLVAD